MGKINFRKAYRLLIWMTCGATLLQATGCGDVLASTAVNILLGSVLSLVFGTPVV